MLEHIQNLTAEEKNIILHAPLYVSVLIAGADGDVSDDEKHRIIELIHTKTFSEKYELKELYKTLDHDAAGEIRAILADLPSNKDERNEILSNTLAKLNKIMPKLEHRFQVQFYKSLKQFAFYVAHSEGGFWGVGSVKHSEEHYMHLPMIQDPDQDED